MTEFADTWPDPRRDKLVLAGCEPTLLTRKEVDALYDTLEAVTLALAKLEVDYIVTGGSLLGAIRQHSILFCDDDIDIAIIDTDGGGNYERVSSNLQMLLGDSYIYSVKPWEGGDRVRPKKMPSVFLDVFTLRRFVSIDDLTDLIGIKKNGKPQSQEYVQDLIGKIEQSSVNQGECAFLCPFWHFNTRKAVEMWPKEVYRECELFPLSRNLKFGPLTGVFGPRAPVKVLKRAFGLDCFHVYYQSSSHKSVGAKIVTEPKIKQNDTISNDHDSSNVESFELPPLILGGGVWESGEKVQLEDYHYIPMQPMTKSKRRHTLHGKEALFRYLQEQSELEDACLRLEYSNYVVNSVQSQVDNKDNISSNTYNVDSMSPENWPKEKHRRTVYMDGVFDLFHVGHLAAIRQCALLGDRVIIGVTGDADATGYKRSPIISEENRVAVVAAIKEVDYVICPCPLIVTEKFMEEHGIDLVVHGFASEEDAKRQEEFFATPIKNGKFKQIEYYKDLSTTDIINKICAAVESIENSVESRHDEIVVVKSSKPQWFGATLAAATNNSAEIPYHPFLHRITVEPFVRKATIRRAEAIRAIRDATGPDIYDKIMGQFTSSLGNEGDFTFQTSEHPLIPSFLQSCGLPEATDLSRIHETRGVKDLLFKTLNVQYLNFQQVFDEFVRAVCAPKFCSIFDCDEIYYQAFPCVRIVQPDEFSIGPHADVAYGHHPCSVNFYVPLTQIRGSSSLFLESLPGSEDWHPIIGNYGSIVKHFAGAICSHWTTENKTDLTRVSLDFRLIAGPMFHALRCGGSYPGGQLDVYRQKEGYYSCCKKTQITISSTSAECGQPIDSGIKWERIGPLLSPDYRVGFPWTVKNWDFITNNDKK